MAEIELQAEEFTLAQLASELLKSNPGSRCYGKLYSFVPPNFFEAIRFIQSIPVPADAVPNRNPVTIIIGKFSKIVETEGKIIPCTKDGALHLHVAISKPNLPECSYLALLSPTEKTKNGTNYLRAIEAIDFIKSLLTLSFGSLATYTYVADFEFDAEGRTSFATDSFRRPALADFQQFLDTQLIEEIAIRLKLQLPTYRNQIRKACSFLSNALNQKDESFRFSSYWIALEVLVGGRAGAIKAKLAQAYQKPLSFIDVNLRFREISKLRTTYFITENLKF